MRSNDCHGEWGNIRPYLEPSLAFLSSHTFFRLFPPSNLNVLNSLLVHCVNAVEIMLQHKSY
jgi:hypothetical protein